MPCSRCHQSGHNILTCKVKDTPSNHNEVKRLVVKRPVVKRPVVKTEDVKTESKIEDVKSESKPEVKKMVLTEDTGKMLEMAICMAYNIPYDGKYKYGMDKPRQLVQRLQALLPNISRVRHTAKRGARYDFSSEEDGAWHLSAKSTKKGVGKVAPQVIGQSQPSAFCRIVGIEERNVEDLKRYIQANIHQILSVLASYTFDCSTIYYNEQQNTLRYISLKTDIDWRGHDIEWTCDWMQWKNSSTAKIKTPCGAFVPLLEVQFHSASRSNMAIRWCYDNVLMLFSDNFTIKTEDSCGDRIETL